MATKRKAAAVLVEDTEMIVLDDIEIKKEPEIVEEHENYELDMKPTAVDKVCVQHSMILSSSID